MSHRGSGPNAELLLLLTPKSTSLNRLRALFRETHVDGSQLATLLPESALPKLAHAAGISPELPPVIVTLPAPAEATTVFVASLIDHVDLQRSSLLVTQRHAILPGRDTIRLVFALRRLSRLSATEFCDYWLHRHSEFGRRLLPPYTYHQLHADRDATERFARVTGIAAADYDGLVEVHFPDLDAFVAQLSRPEVAEGALADERNFIDHERSVFWAYREEAIGTPVA